tara:strand:- start:2303 stop:2647 length:345 start_codon:yes stop_codon:yes gene_type:complete
MRTTESQRDEVRRLHRTSKGLESLPAVLTVAGTLRGMLAHGGCDVEAFVDAWNTHSPALGDPSTDPRGWSADALPTWSPSEIEEMFAGDAERIDRAQFNAAAFSNAVRAVAGRA